MKLKILLLCFIILIAIYFSFFYKVTIVLTNKTGTDLASIKFKDKVVNELKKDETIKIYFWKFSFDSGLPDENIEAISNGNHLSNYNRDYFCGTEKYLKYFGKYRVGIFIQENDSCQILNLRQIEQ